MAQPLTRERVVDTALSIIEADGVDRLSMRALSAKLGMAVTAIYWHVGNKQDLLAAMVERIGTEVGAVRTTGRTPHQRVVSTARSLLASIDAHRALVGLAHQQGQLAVVFAPARRALAEAFSDAGLRGARLADAVNAVIQMVAAFSLTEAVVQRSPKQRTDDGKLWEGPPPIDKAAAARLHQPTDPARTFDVSLDSLVTGLLA
jgi:TetR/AcrR family transcriptional regulator, tetracycline repressor protein